MSAVTRLGSGLLAAWVVAGCGQSDQRSKQATGSSHGSAGVYFFVSVSRPTEGTVTSQDGQILCGTGGSACTGRYGWSAQAVLTATPDPGYMFGTWAGDCQYSGPCVLDTSNAGADKFIVAVFGLAGEAQHGNFTSPAIHGPAFLDRLAGLPGTFDCSSSSCHGPSYGGRGFAPSCNSCHAAAGWDSWLTNCTFCHGTRVKSGYAFASDPAKAAPPDAVGQRLTGAPAPARTGAHQQHLAGRTAAGAAYAAPSGCATCHAVPANLSHVRGSTARASVVLPGAGQASLPASLGTYDDTTGACLTYCHGDGKVAGTSPTFSSAGIACSGCHGVPPSSGHPYRGADLTMCASCHRETMSSDGTLLASGGKHVDGLIQATGACDACHGFPPATGAHVAHFGLTGPATSGYGDTRALADMFPGESPTSAPGVYAFGCGSCHPLDFASHRNGVADVVLYEAAAPTGSLKKRAASTAAYDVGAGTCSGVYCHSSGQATPTYRTTPAWTSGASLACGGCHENPPRYASGGAGSVTANSHVNLADDGWEFGHFLGMLGPYHGSKHGGNWGPSDDAAPITCQTCHADTTDPSNTGPSGFYYLDTTGDYVLPDGDPTRHSGWSDGLRCTTCHTSTSATAPIQPGKVLPLRHVNGVRDVVFDARETLPAISWLPPSPRTPVQPYWFTGASWILWTGVPASWSSDSISFSLSRSAYDPTTKTCTSVACHIGENPQWGRPYQYVTNGGATCNLCHPM